MCRASSRSVSRGRTFEQKTGAAKISNPVSDLNDQDHSLNEKENLWPDVLREVVTNENSNTISPALLTRLSQQISPAKRDDAKRHLRLVKYYSSQVLEASETTRDSAGGLLKQHYRVFTCRGLQTFKRTQVYRA